MRIPPARIVFSDADRAKILGLVDESLRTGSLTLGPHTRAFEDAFAARHGGGHAVATSSGTSALEIILRGLGLDGGEVIVPTNTFFASAAAVLHAGGRVRLADIDAHTLALTPATIEAAWTDRTVGVLHVHVGGFVSPDIEAVAAMCRRRGIWLVEDAAHAHGSSHNGRSAGTFGIAGAFSFYPTKVITSGEGGMILTDDTGLRDEALLYRDQGKAGFLGGDHVRLGYAWRMSEVHAAVGTVHLGHLDEWITHRTAIAGHFDEALAAVAGITPLDIPDGAVCNYYKYIALLDHGIDREVVKRRLRESFEVSASGEVYAKPLHRHPVFEALAHGPLPIADDVCARHICLPLHSDMNDEEADHVITAVRAVMADVV